MDLENTINNNRTNLRESPSLPHVEIMNSMSTKSVVREYYTYDVKQRKTRLTGKGHEKNVRVGIAQVAEVVEIFLTRSVEQT